LKITHVITRLVVGGAQENTLATVRGLRRKPGVEVNLITGPATGPEGSLENEAGKIFMADPKGFSIVSELVRPVHPLNDFRALKKLQTIFSAQKPDIVHTHSGKAGILGRLAARRAGVPVIIHHIHGPSFGNFQGAFANLVFTAAEKHAAKVTNHFFCSADAMTRLYLAAGIGKPGMFTRIFSGFNLQPFLEAGNDPSLRKKLGLDGSNFVIGKVGRIFKLKGHADLLRAFARIQAEIPHARVLFVGDGILRGEMEALAHKLGIADKVIFTGLVPPDEVARHVGIMDCLAHLSYREALSRALPQALAAGKPVVAYDFDGANEVCRENETGFLVRTGDIGTAAERLLLLAKKPELRKQFGDAGSVFVRANFSVEKMVDAQYTVYQQLAAKRGLRA